VHGVTPERTKNAPRRAGDLRGSNKKCADEICRCPGKAGQDLGRGKSDTWGGVRRSAVVLATLRPVSFSVFRLIT
jgi:hypothetical protein